MVKNKREGFACKSGWGGKENEAMDFTGFGQLKNKKQDKRVRLLNLTQFQPAKLFFI